MQNCSLASIKEFNFEIFENKLHLNIDPKCAIHFDFKIVLAHNAISQVQAIKYFDVIFDEKLNWSN